MTNPLNHVVLFFLTVATATIGLSVAQADARMYLDKRRALGRG